MDFSNSNKITVNEILSDVLRNVDDEPMRKFSKGYYTSLIQQAIEQVDLKLGMTKTPEYFAYAPVIPIPANAFNVREIYAFSGDCCDVATAQTIWYKRNYKGGYANRVTKNTSDPFISAYSAQDSVFYYNVFNGDIYLSPACAAYPRVMVVFNGLSTPIGTTPFIPIQIRKALCDYVTVEVFKKLKARLTNLKEAQTYRALYAEAYNELYNKMTGSWWDAKEFISNMNTHSRESLLEYFSKANE